MDAPTNNETVLESGIHVAGPNIAAKALRWPNRPAAWQTVRVLSWTAFGTVVLSASPVARGGDIYDFAAPWRWSHFTTQEGLPSNRVVGICEASDRTVWAATASGLAWYDGYLWHPMGPQAGVPSQRVRSVSVAANSKIIAVIGHNVYRGDRAGFEPIELPLDDLELTPLLAVPGREGAILLLALQGTSGERGFYRWDGEALAPLEDHRSKAGVTFDGVWGTTEAELWSRTSNWQLMWGDDTAWTDGVARRRPGRDPSSEASGAGGYIWSDHPGPNRGLWQWRAGHRAEHVLPLEWDRVTALAVAADGTVAAAAHTGRVHVRRGGQWSLLDPAPRPFASALSLRFRSNGDLWVGTYDGLYLYRAAESIWQQWKEATPDSRNRVNEIAEATDGSVWLVSSEGVARRDPDGEVQRWSQMDGQSIRDSTGLCQDQDGNIWISSGSAYRGSFRFDGTDWRHFGSDEELIGYVHKVRRDRRGRPWFLGLDDGSSDQGRLGTGAAVYEDGKFQRWTSAEGLLNDRVYAFAEGLEGEFWFGTLGGLSRWKAGEWTHWTMANGLAHSRIFTLAVDEQNRVWFGDDWNGLGTLENDVPRYLTTDTGLPNDSVADIRSDPHGGIWLSFPGGVMRLAEGRQWAIRLPGDMLHAIPWPVVPSKRRVYIGTLGEGALVLDRAALEGVTLQVALTEPGIRDGAASFRWQAVAHEDRISPDDIETRYRLDDGAWSTWSVGRLAHVPVSRGGHKFAVQARSRLAESPTSEQTIYFDVPAPFYRHPIFVASVLGGLLALVSMGLLMIGRQRRHLAAVRASEQRYRDLFENAHDAILVFDRQDETILEVNQRACEIYGFSKDELVGGSLDLVQPPGRRGSKRTQEILDRSPPAGFELLHHRKNGDAFYVAVNSALIRYRGRAAILSINRDISERKRIDQEIRQLNQELDQRVTDRTAQLERTNRTLQDEVNERKRSEAALKESEERLRQIAEHTSEVIWLTDWLKKELLYVNPAYETLFGMSCESLYADRHSWTDRIHPEDKDRVSRQFREDADLGRTTDEEYRLVLDDGEHRWIRDRAIPIFNATGRVSRIVGIAEDVTERKQADAVRRALEEQAQHARRMESLSVLAGGVAHDLNNLLVSVLGHTRLAREQVPPETPVADLLQRIDLSSQRAAELANQMLACSGRGRRSTESVVLNSLAAETIELCAHSIPAGCTLRRQIAEQPLWVEGDPTQLRQVLMNLVINAAEAIGERPGVISLRTGAWEPKADAVPVDSVGDLDSGGSRVFVEVEDTGCGISQTARAKMFDPYYSTKCIGRGLGLAVVQGIVLSHGGALQVRSTPGTGTTMTVVLPTTARRPKSTDRPDRRRATEPAHAHSLILVVDDQEVVRTVTQRSLEQYGFRVLTAENGGRAIERFAERPQDIDAVLLDLTMPDMNGMQVFRQMRAVRPDLPIVLTSGYDESDAAREVGQEPHSCFLPKPYAPRELVDAITAVINDGLEAPADAPSIGAADSAEA
ncbi:MAG: PAS domain S-box protein [bacterium]|nr:PAS domain S-box protein [bacterium]